MPGDTYMSAGATATATAVRDSPRPEHQAEDRDREDVTLVVPAVPGRPDLETSPSMDPETLQVLREPVTQEQPAVTSEPTTQDASTDDDPPHL